MGGLQPSLNSPGSTGKSDHVYCQQSIAQNTAIAAFVGKDSELPCFTAVNTVSLAGYADFIRWTA
jgi:hypothetical protein